MVPAKWFIVAIVIVSAFTARISYAQQVIPIQGLNRSSLVSFDREVLPILRKKCVTCHSQSELNGELNLETAQMILKGGESGPAVVPKKSDDSLLLKVASHRDNPTMPPPGNDVGAVNLTPQELGLIKLWIDQGAQGSGTTSVLSPTAWRPLPKGLNPIYAVAVSPDGQYAACGRANQIFIYHVVTGQLVTRLTDPDLQSKGNDDRPGIAHLDVVQSLAFNSRGDMLASGGFRVAKLWRRPRDVRRSNLASTDAVTSVAVSPDGKVAATGSADNSIKLWNLETGETTVALDGHSATVSSLQFSDYGDKLVSASADKTIRVWDPVNGKLIGRIDTSTELNAVTLVTELIPQTGEDGKLVDPLPVQRIATGGGDNFIRLWQLPNGLSEPLAEVPATSNVLAVSPDRKLLAIANAAGQISIVEFESRKPIHTWQAHEGAIHSVAFRPVPLAPEVAKADDIKAPVVVPQLATSGSDNTVRIWNYETQEPLDVIHGSLVPVKSLAFAPNGKRLVTGAADGTVSIWDLTVAAPIDVPAEKTGVATVSAVSPDGKLLATSAIVNNRPAVVVRNTETRETTQVLFGHLASITSLSFSADNTKLATGSADKTARVWNLSDRKFPEVATFAGHADSVTAVAFNSNAAQVLSGSTDGSLKLWNVADELEAMSFAGHTGAIVAVAMPPTNQPISASADKTVRFWNPADGKQVRTIATPAVITSMAMSRDGTKAAIGGADNTIHLHQVADGKLLLSLAGHTAALKTLAFSADNTRLVSGGADNNTVVWNVADGRVLEILPVADGLASATYGADLKTLFIADAKGAIQQHLVRLAVAVNGFTKPINKVAFHPNGQTVYAAGEQGFIRGFNATTGAQTLTATHGAPIHDFALSPNTQQLASAGENMIIRIWNSANGAPLAPTQLVGFTGPVKSVCYTADSTRVIGSGGVATGELFVFDLTNAGELEQSLVGHTATVGVVVTAGESERVVSASADDSVRAWQLTGIKRIAGHSQPVTSLATIPAVPMQILSGSNDATVRHWNLINGQALRQMNHGGPVTAVAVRPDGQRFASTSTNNTAKLWNATNGAQLAEMRGDILAKNRVAKSTQQQTDATARVAAATAAVKAAETALPVKQSAATAAADALAKANTDVQTKSTAMTTTAAAKAAAEQLAIQAAAVAQKADVAKIAAERVAALCEAEAKAAMDKATRTQAAATANPENTALVQAAKVVQDALTAANAKLTAAKTAIIAPTQQATTTAAAAAAAAQKAAATNKPSSDALAALRLAQGVENNASQANVFALRDLKLATDAVPATKSDLAAAEATLAKTTSELAAATKAETEAQQPLRTLAFSPDNRQLATGGDFNVVHTWNADNGVAVTSYVGHEGPIQTLAYISEEGLLTGSIDKTAAVWDLNPGWELERTIGKIDDPTQLINRVVAIDFSDDGELLCTGGGVPSRGGEVKIWKVADGSLVRSMPDAHTDAVFGVDFSRDGELVATGGADKYVRVFNVATGERVQQFEGHTNHVLGVTWRANRKMLASCAADGTINIWNAETGDRLRSINTFKKQVSSIRFIGESNVFATCSADRILRMHNSDNAGVVRNFIGTGDDFLYSVDVTPNSSILVTGGYDSVLRIWNGTAANSQPIQSIEPPMDAAEDISQGSASDSQQASK